MQCACYHNNGTKRCKRVATKDTGLRWICDQCWEWWNVAGLDVCLS